MMMLDVCSRHRLARMAGTVIANALVFLESVAETHERVKHLALVCGYGLANPQGVVLAAGVNSVVRRLRAQTKPHSP